MIGATMLHGLLVAALLVASADQAERALRRVGAPARMVWVAALVGSLLLPLAELWRDRTDVTHTAAIDTGVLATPDGASAVASEAEPPHRVSAGQPSTPRAGAPRPTISLFVRFGGARRAGDEGPLSFLEAIPAALGSARAALATLRLPSVPHGLDRTLAMLWAVLSGALGVATAAGLMQLRRDRRRWSRRRVEGTEVLVSERFGPAVVGLLRTEVVLPRWVLHMDAPQRRRSSATRRSTGACATPSCWRLARWPPSQRPGTSRCSGRPGACDKRSSSTATAVCSGAALSPWLTPSYSSPSSRARELPGCRSPRCWSARAPPSNGGS